MITRHGPVRLLALAAVSVALSACSLPVKLDAGNPIAVASCPATLPLLTDDSFGATVTKLVEVAGIYHKCRAAAIGTSPTTDGTK